MESSPSFAFDGSIQIPTTLPDSPLLSLVPRHPVTTDTNEYYHKVLKNMVMQHRLVSERKVTTGRDGSPPPPPPQPQLPDERALNGISSSSMRRHQEFITHMHEITNRSFSLPMREDPVTLLIADLIDDFDGSHWGHQCLFQYKRVFSSTTTIRYHTSSDANSQSFLLLGG